MAISYRFSTGLERNCPADSYGYIKGEQLTRLPFPKNSVGLGITNEDAHTGDYSLKISGTEVDVVSSMRWYKEEQYGYLRLGLWYKPSEIFGTNDEACVVCMYGDGKEWGKVCWNESGTLYISQEYQGILGTAPNHPAGEWVHIAIGHYCHDTSGKFYCNINGEPIVEFEGYTAPSNYYEPDSYYFGSYPRDATRNQGTPVGAFYDDMYMSRGIWSDPIEGTLPDSRFLDIVPNGDGYYTEWAQSPESPPLTSLYEAIDDVQTETDTPNIKAWGQDQRALFTMQNIVAPNGFSIPNVRLWLSAKRNAHSSPYLYVNPGTRIDGVDNFVFKAYVTTAWGLFPTYNDFGTDAQYNNWTEASVNASEFGLRTIV